MKEENFQSIFKRRGKDLNSIPVHHHNNHANCNSILETPCDVTNFFKWAHSPIKNTFDLLDKDFAASMNSEASSTDVKPLTSSTDKTNSTASGKHGNICHHFHNFHMFQNDSKTINHVTKEAQLSPSCIADDFSEYLDDIKYETSVSPVKDIENSTKINWLKSDCCPNDNHAMTALNSSTEEMRLLLPETSEMITPNTPVVLKRKGKKELNVYLPKKITPAEVSKLTPKILHKLRKKEESRTDNKFVFPPIPQPSDQSSCSAIEADQSQDCKKAKIKGRRCAVHKTRDFHNRLERLRRGQQYERFQKLREVVPSMKNKPKAPKISILQAAISYIRQLRDQEMVAKETIIIEKRRNDHLLKRLCYLTKTTPKIH